MLCRVTASATAKTAPRVIGRYAIYDAIATGGMATVHLGRLSGPVGFTKTVAVKRLHAQFAHDPEFVAMFMDEARLAARIHHPNVIQTLDVVSTDGELFLVMEYVRGETLSRLVRAAVQSNEPIPPRIVVSLISGVLQGLHAAHEASDDAGKSLALVHRDVSPQNVLVGLDGTARLLDFGVAKAENKTSSTREGQLKGKLLYMSPEQLEGEDVDRRTDVYATAIVLFEALTGKRMFSGKSEGAQIAKITRGEIVLPSVLEPSLAPFDSIVKKGGALKPSDRYATAREMAQALEKIAQPASAAEVAEWVERSAGATLEERAKRVAEIESRVQPSTRPRRRRAVWLFVLLALGSIVILSIAGIAISIRSGNPQVPTTTVPPPPTSAVTTEPTPTTEPLTPAPSASIAVTAPKATTQKPIASTTKPDCEQPYVVDSVGHMHFRKECLPK
jgi:serine/threonine-protein kinase